MELTTLLSLTVAALTHASIRSQRENNEHGRPTIFPDSFRINRWQEVTNNPPMLRSDPELMPLVSRLHGIWPSPALRTASKSHFYARMEQSATPLSHPTTRPEIRKTSLSFRRCSLWSASARLVPEIGTFYCLAWPAELIRRVRRSYSATTDSVFACRDEAHGIDGR